MNPTRHIALQERAIQCGMWECESARPAQDFADASQLPQTVFYHPEWGFAHTHPFARILTDKATEMRVTWLPSNYWTV